MHSSSLDTTVLIKPFSLYRVSQVGTVFDVTQHFDHHIESDWYMPAYSRCQIWTQPLAHFSCVQKSLKPISPHTCLITAFFISMKGSSLKFPAIFRALVCLSLILLVRLKFIGVRRHLCSFDASISSFSYFHQYMYQIVKSEFCVCQLFTHTHTKKKKIKEGRKSFKIAISLSIFLFLDTVKSFYFIGQ